MSSQLRKVAGFRLGFGSVIDFERVRVPCSWCIGAQFSVRCGGCFILRFVSSDVSHLIVEFLEAFLLK